MELFASLLLVVLGTVLACYGLGIAALKMMRVSAAGPQFQLFLALTIGLVLLVSSYALVSTGGRTVLLPVLVLMLAATWLLRQPEAMNHDSSATGRPLAVLLGLSIVLFAGRWLLLYDPASPFLRTPFQDYVYYGRLTLPLNQLGLETMSLDTLYPQFLTTMPYHYLEVWLNAALVRLTGLPAAWCLYLGTYSALITIAVAGFWAVLVHFGLRAACAAPLALVMVLATGVYWPVFEAHSFTQNGALVASSMLVVQPKLAPVYILTLLGLLLLLRGRYQASALVLGCLPLVFVTTLPTVCAALVGLALYLWRSKHLAGRAALGVAAPAVAAAVYIGVFYFLKAEPYQFPGTGRAYTMAALLPVPAEWRTIINNGIGTLLSFGLYYGPYAALLAVLLWWGRRRLGRWPWAPSATPVLVWLGISAVVAAAVRALTAHFLDSNQFFANPIIPLASVAVAVGLGLALASLPTRWVAAATAVVLGLAVVNGYKLFTFTAPMHVTTRHAPAFLRQVQAALPALGQRGGYLLADADYESAYTLSPDSYTAGTYVSDFKNDYVLTSLSALDPDSLRTDPRFAHDSAQAEQIVRRSGIYRFARFRALQHRPPLSPDSTKYKFSKQFNVRFICASRRAVLPKTLLPQVQSAYVDVWSGEKFYALRPWR